MAHHSDTCQSDAAHEPEHVSTTLQITVGHRADGSPCTVIRFASGQRLVSEPGSPDLGFDETSTVLHDVAHTLLACALGLTRSPVLERVVDLRPLDQGDVDLEEAAVFAFQAWCLSLQGEDPTPAVVNARASLNRYHGVSAA